MKPLSKCQEEVVAEIQVMKMCRNRYIVNFMEALAFKDRIFLVMLYCDGGSLDSVISKMELSEAAIAHTFFSVLNGLDYLERICLVHRDIVSSLGGAWKFLCFFYLIFS